jgi:protein tyrosine phosphatase
MELYPESYAGMKEGVVEEPGTEEVAKVGADNVSSNGSGPGQVVRVGDAEVEKQMNEKLREWEECQSAYEYFDIPYRSAFKKQVSHPVLNRFGGSMGPYEDCLMNDIPAVQYINATAYPSGYLPGKSKEYSFIATMCPKLETFEHFRLMVWDKNTKVVVNLVNRKDKVGSRPSDKQERYWPPYRPGTGVEAQCQNWKILVETVDERESANVKGLWRSQVRLTLNGGGQGGGEERTVIIFWYMDWVDFGKARQINKPGFNKNAANIVRLIQEVERASASLGVDARSPTVVHCSAGVGRTGTYITLSRVLHELESLRAGDANVRFVDKLQTFLFEVIQHLRIRRLWMVKSEFEYGTIFSAVKSYVNGEGLEPILWP